METTPDVTGEGHPLPRLRPHLSQRVPGTVGGGAGRGKAGPNGWSRLLGPQTLLLPSLRPSIHPSVRPAMAGPGPALLLLLLLLAPLPGGELRVGGCKRAREGGHGGIQATRLSTPETALTQTTESPSTSTAPACQNPTPTPFVLAGWDTPPQRELE